MSETAPGGERTPDGGPPPDRAYEPFNVANLMKAQQRLLTGGGAAQPPGGSPGGGPGGPVPDGRAAEPKQFDLQDYLDVLLRRWAYVAIPLVLVPLLTFVHSLFGRSRHQATARLLLNPNLVGRVASDDLLDGNVYVSSTAIAQMAKLESVRKLGAEAMRKWAAGDDRGLLGRLWAPPAGGDPSAEGEAPRHDRGMMTPGEAEILASSQRTFDLVSYGTTVIPGTQNVAVEVLSLNESELVAAATADALVAAIVERFNERRYEQWRTTLIRDHINTNRRELEHINRKIADLRSDAAAAGRALGGIPLELERQYELLKEHQLNLRSLSYMIEESTEKIDLLQQETTRAAKAPPEELIKRLIDLELERNEMIDHYTDKHPKMRKINEDIRRAERLIEEYPKRREALNAGGVRYYNYYNPSIQLAVERARLAGLEARKNELNETIETVHHEIDTNAQERSLKYELYLTERKVLQDIAARLQMRLQRAELVKNRKTEAGGIVEAVAAETEEIGPRRWQTVMLGTMVGLVAGMVLAFLAERLDESVRLPAEMRALTGMPTLQVVPLFRGALVVRPEEAVSGIANVFAVLRNNIRYSAPDSPEKSVLVTSATEGEGKSLIAVNLAISFAQEGSRVCLVDADVQKGERHAMEEAVKLAWEPQAGLTTYLEGDAELANIIVPSVQLTNLAFVGSGGRAANPPRALKSERASELFRALAEEFDVVVVDAPPVLPVVDAALIAGHCLSAIHVVRYGHTRRAELEESVRRLRHVGAPVIGLVLNCARRDSSGYYYRRYRESA